jgi:hypothetical protein
MMAEQSYLINKHEERAGSFFFGGGGLYSLNTQLTQLKRAWEREKAKTRDSKMIKTYA